MNNDLPTTVNKLIKQQQTIRLYRGLNWPNALFKILVNFQIEHVGPRKSKLLTEFQLILSIQK